MICCDTKMAVNDTRVNHSGVRRRRRCDKCGRRITTYEIEAPQEERRRVAKSYVIPGGLMLELVCVLGSREGDPSKALLEKLLAAMSDPPGTEGACSQSNESTTPSSTTTKSTETTP